MSARKRAHQAASPRAVTIPAEAAKRIREAQAQAEVARARVTEITLAVLEGMGETVEKREDGQMWNVLDAGDGTLRAVFGPRMTALPIAAPTE